MEKKKQRRSKKKKQKKKQRNKQKKQQKRRKLKIPMSKVNKVFHNLSKNLQSHKNSLIRSQKRNKQKNHHLKK